MPGPTPTRPGTTGTTTSWAPMLPASFFRPVPESTRNPGDRVVAHCLSVELESPLGHNDTMMDPEQRIWGFETNFGGLAQLAIVKANQLLPKPEHLTWRKRPAGTGQLHGLPSTGVSQRWGDEAGRRGSHLGSLRRLGFLRDPIRVERWRHPCVCRFQREQGRGCALHGSRPDHRSLGGGYKFWKDETTQDPKEWQRLGKKIRQLTGGDDIDIVFEHPGRETFGASVYVTRKGGTIVTCASTSGFMHEYITAICG